MNRKLIVILSSVLVLAVLTLVLVLLLGGEGAVTAIGVSVSGSELEFYEGEAFTCDTLTVTVFYTKANPETYPIGALAGAFVANPVDTDKVVFPGNSSTATVDVTVYYDKDGRRFSDTYTVKIVRSTLERLKVSARERVVGEYTKSLGDYLVPAADLDYADYGGYADYVAAFNAAIRSIEAATQINEVNTAVETFERTTVLIQTSFEYLAEKLAEIREEKTAALLSALYENLLKYDLAKAISGSNGYVVGELLKGNVGGRFNVYINGYSKYTATRDQTDLSAQDSQALSLLAETYSSYADYSGSSDGAATNDGYINGITTAYEEGVSAVCKAGRSDVASEFYRALYRIEDLYVYVIV